MLMKASPPKATSQESDSTIMEEVGMSVIETGWAFSWDGEKEAEIIYRQVDLESTHRAHFDL